MNNATSIAASGAETDNALATDAEIAALRDHAWLVQYARWARTKLFELEAVAQHSSTDKLEANSRRAEHNRRNTGATFPTPEQHAANNSAALHTKCRNTLEDLELIKKHHGDQSPEYAAKLHWAQVYIGHALPAVLERALNDLRRHGHDEPPRTKEID